MPPRDASFSALAARVSAAAERLSERERSVLALRERESLDYAAIGASLGTDVAEVADLLVAARLAVRGTVRGAAPPEVISEDCPPARRLLAARQDGEAVDAAAAAWVREHVDGCDACQAARRGLREASLACRAWQDGPVAATAPVSLPPPPRRTPPSPRAPGARRRRGLEALVAGLLTTGVAAMIAAAMTGGSPPPAVPETSRPEVIPAAAGADERAASRRRRQGGSTMASSTPEPVSTPAATVAPGEDIVPPPGDKFCPAGDPNCR